MNRHYLFEHEHEGIVCLSCGKIMVSYSRHDCKTCGCEQATMIDGGQVGYTRYGGKSLDLLRHVRIIPILLTKTGKVSKKKIKTVREMFGRSR